jgi:hypothetical protein
MAEQVRAQLQAKGGGPATGVETGAGLPEPVETLPAEPEDAPALAPVLPLPDTGDAVVPPWRAREL